MNKTWRIINIISIICGTTITIIRLFYITSGTPEDTIFADLHFLSVSPLILYAILATFNVV